MNINFLVITANVGSLFEDLEGIEKAWMNEILNIVKKCQAHFVALHCQEVGGKDYKASLDPIKAFYRKLVDSESTRDYTTVRAFVDGDVDLADQYTALASFYFVHKSVKDAKIYNYKSERYNNVTGKQIYVNKLHVLPHVRKEKFPQSFAPDSKRSRKGHCRVRWKLYDKPMEFVNVHLFHDDSNLISFQSSPSPYTAYRKRALEHVLKKLNEDQPIENDLYFIFGDFNFRLDVRALVESICESCQQQEIKSETDQDEIVRIQFRRNESNGSPADLKQEKNGGIVLLLEKKRFVIRNELTSVEGLRLFDNELTRLDEKLKEFNVEFPPTYPFSENVKESDRYMETRCPSWCDRVLLSPSCWDWLQSQDGVKEFSYNTLGESVCVGDHKPVYLSFTVPLGEDSSTKGAFASLFQSCSFL